MSTNFHHLHNVVEPDRALAERPWGIRVSLPERDPFTRLVGADWSRQHWYASRAERDAALEQMRTRHGYYRVGDEISLVFSTIDPRD